MQTATIFKSGNSQAVRIPKDYRFDEKNSTDGVMKLILSQRR